MRAVRERSAEDGFLAAIISTVSSSLDLDEVLAAVVALLSEASGVHACFVYLLEPDSSLRLRAASAPYGAFVNEVVLAPGEGLAGWVVERGKPAFIRENALADPRVKQVPELDEERFQSLVCVPVTGRGGEPIGVVSAHSEAPRTFTRQEVDFLVASASLVAGAIENARLYAETRARLRELEGLTELGEAIAAAQTLEDLLPRVAASSLELLSATRCHLYLLEPADEDLQLAASAPKGGSPRRRIGLGELGPELERGGRRSRLAVPLVAGGELVGLLIAEGSVQHELARAVGNQAAVGIKKLRLIERLAERNLIADLFDDLAGGRTSPDLEGRAARLGCDLDAAHVVLFADAGGEQLERALAAFAPGSLFDRRDDRLRALLAVPSEPEALPDAVREVHARLDGPSSIGLSNVCSGLQSYANGFAEARQALVGALVVPGRPPVVGYEDLGAYKYLLRIALEGSVRDSTVDAVRRLAAYDRERGSALLSTFAVFLRQRGNVSATADVLFVHPNTLRQRLRRIGDVAGIDLRRDDWLMVEIAVRLVELDQALTAPH